MTNEESIVGYFGKIPSKGDFLTQLLPRNFTDPWDAWLREVLAHGKSVLGDNWMEYYLTAPLYHYALSSGVCGNQNWLGVMMPSVDSVGRYFPMTICKSFSSSSNPLDLIESEKKWLENAEKLLLFCLDENFSRAELDHQLSQLQVEDSDETTITLKKATMNRFEDSAWNFPVHEKENVSVIYPELVNSMLSTFYTSYSVWRTQGSDNLPPSFMVSEGLPPYKSVTAFIDGQWNKWGWSNEQFIR